VALETHTEAEAVPLHRFIPIPNGAAGLTRTVATIGSLTIRVFDPYSIALSKLERGFSSDLGDIDYLVRAGFVDLGQLAQIAIDTIAHPSAIDIDRPAIHKHLQIIMRRTARDASA